MTCQWPFLYLITHDAKVRESMRLLADGIWEIDKGTGYSVCMDDVEHAAEDTLCTQPQMLLVDYGNPLYVERLMKISSYIPMWTGVNARGERLFRSYRFTTMGVSDRPKTDIDHAYCALVMAAPYYLSWYADCPQPKGWFLQWIRTWAQKSMSTEGGKPAGAIPCDIQFATGKVSPYTKSWRKSVYYTAGQYCTRQALIAGYLLSGDRLCLGPFCRTDNAFDGPPGLVWRRITGDKRHDRAFRAKADKLVASYREKLPQPQPGPEVRVVADVTKAKSMKKPFLLEARADAPSGKCIHLPADAPYKSGVAEFDLKIERPGPYALCALLFAEKPGRSAFQGGIDGGQRAIVSTPWTGKWVWAVSDRPVELKAGLHRIRLQGRHPGARCAQVGLTSKFDPRPAWYRTSVYLSNPTLFQAWQASGDKRYLVEMLKETNREQRRQRWLLTDANPATDRATVPGARALPFLFLGGNAGAAKAGYPYLAVSYEGGGTDFAALVLSNDPKHVKLLIYNFAAKQRPVTVRFWQLEHGEYEILLGPDANQDDKMDKVRSRQRRTLARCDGVEFLLPSQELCVIEARQTKALDPIRSRPDLAISPQDIAVAANGRSVRVTVHNIGAAPVPSAEVRIRMNRRTIGSAVVTNLQAPLDSKPRTATLNIKVSQPVAGKRFLVQLDPNNEVPEITKTNNQILHF